LNQASWGDGSGNGQSLLPSTAAHIATHACPQEAKVPKEKLTKELCCINGYQVSEF
jgi:hypothetical protein